MALDLIRGRVYWTETSGNRIRRTNLDCSAPEIVITGSGTDGLTLGPAGAKLYWSQGNQVRRDNLDGFLVEDVLTSLISPFGIDLDRAATGDPYPADLDGDGLVDSADLAMLLGSGGPIRVIPSISTATVASTPLTWRCSWAVGDRADCAFRILDFGL